MKTNEAFPPYRCFTACGFLIADQKIILVKHKKLGIWLAPGGHLEPNELPHEAAKREVFEETGLECCAVTNSSLQSVAEETYLPAPFAVNLHWISKDTYQNRIEKGQSEPLITEKWPKGCEQHLAFLYLMEPKGDLEFKENLEETDGIGWFSPKEAAALHTTEGMRAEVQLAFKLSERQSGQKAYHYYAGSSI